MTQVFEGFVVPSIRAYMGEDWYFVATLQFHQIADCFRRNEEIHSNPRLREWIQRKIDESRAPEIARYLVDQKQRFFNAIIGGVYGGEPDWYPLEVGGSRTVAIDIDERTRASMGILRFTGQELIFAIDGQHRVEAIKLALRIDPSLGDEEQTVIFKAHRRDAVGMERTRRLFSTLNRTARPVTMGEIIALDEDDAFAIATRELLESVAALKDKQVLYSKDLQVPSGHPQAITSILCVHDVAQSLMFGDAEPRRKAKIDQLIKKRPDAATIEKIVALSAEFWTVVAESSPAVKKLLSLTQLERTPTAIEELRGHAHLRPVGQQALARATRVLMDRGATLSVALRRLLAVDDRLATHPWIGVLWDMDRKRMLPGKARLAANLLLHQLGEKPDSAKFDTLRRYQRAVGNTSAQLP